MWTLKKGICLLRPNNQVKQNLIGKLRAEKAADTVRMCKLFKVSRAGIYAAKKPVNAPKTICATTVALKSAFEKSGQTDGTRRLQQALQQHHGIKSCAYTDANPSAQDGLEAKVYRHDG